jgi:chitin synthase
MNALPVFFNMDKSIELLSVLLHYIYYSPTYIHGLLIFAFCRIDDLSWGTKGLEAESGKENL